MNVSQGNSRRELNELAASKHDALTRRLTQLVQDQVYKVNHTMIGQLRNASHEYDAPSGDTILEIAYLAGVEESVAFTVAGHPVPGQPLADEPALGVDNFSPKSRKAIVDMVRVLIDLETSNHAQPATDHAEPQRNLRAVDTGPDHSGTEQKSGLPDSLEVALARFRLKQALKAEEQGGYGITEINSDESAKYPAPLIEQLATYPKVKTIQELRDETTFERDDRSTDKGDA